MCVCVFVIKWICMAKWKCLGKNKINHHITVSILRYKCLEWHNVRGWLTLTAQKWHIRVILEPAHWYAPVGWWGGCSRRLCGPNGVTCRQAKGKHPGRLPNPYFPAFLSGLMTRKYVFFPLSLRLRLRHNSIFKRWLLTLHRVCVCVCVCMLAAV